MTIKLTHKTFIHYYQDMVKLNKIKNYQTGGGKFYPQANKEFFWWLEQQGILDIAELTTPILLQYYEYLQARPNQRGGTLSDTSISHHLFALKLFVNYLVDRELLYQIAQIPTHGRKQKERPVLTVEEIKLLYNYTQNSLEKTILALAYGCGLRRTEITKLQTNDISLSKGYLVVREGKNGRRREVPLSDKVIQDLKEYLTYERTQRWNPKEPTKSLLLNTQGRVVRGGVLNDYFKALVERTGNKTIQDKVPTLHTLRHSIATHLAENGAGIDFIQSFLGHVTIDTSQLYIIRRKRTKNLRP